MEELANNNLNQLNSLENPLALAPQKSEITIKGKKIDTTLKPYSFSVITIPFH
jgi:alpha-L-arabinofuranosidase